MSAVMQVVAQSFAEVLRASRRGCGQSQLQTALAAGVSQRHLSFLESGRAQPGRGVVLGLSAAMGLSLTQQNRLLLAAGFAPIFQPQAHDDGEVQLIERAMQAFLQTHEPYPALLLRDGAWIEKGNRGAAKLWSAVRGQVMHEVPQDNIFDLMLRRGPGRERLQNWGEAAACLLRRQMAEHAQTRDPRLAATLAALAANPEVRELLRREPDAQPSPVVLLRYRFDAAEVNLFVVIASLHAPLDTRVEHLRVEFFVPADEASADWFRAV